MKKQKLTKEKVKYFIKDEAKAAAEYTKYGLEKLARDERKHKRYLRRKERRL